MYQRYYTSSDIQLWLTNSSNGTTVQIDTSLSISYSLQQTSSPIYSLGSRHVQFYSHGNTIGSGSLTIAFTDEEYLKACLDYIGGSYTEYSYQDPTGLYNTSVGAETASNFRSNKLNKASNKELRNLKNIQTTTKLSMSNRLISIGSIRPLFDIVMYINNETAIQASDSKVIRLAGVKIVSDSMSSNSMQDAPLMITYNFVFKDLLRG